MESHSALSTQHLSLTNHSSLPASGQQGGAEGADEQEHALAADGAVDRSDLRDERIGWVVLFGLLQAGVEQVYCVRIDRCVRAMRGFGADRNGDLFESLHEISDE